MKIMTRGNVCVSTIKKGDVHYHYEDGTLNKVVVKEAPIKDNNGDYYWVGYSKNKTVEFFYIQSKPNTNPYLYDHDIFVR